MNPDLVTCLKSINRLIYFVTDEEDRFINLFMSDNKDSIRHTWVFNATLGLIPIEQLTKDWQTRAHAENRDTMSIHDALIRIYQDDPKREVNFYIITDPDRWLRDEHVQRRLLNIVHQLHNNQQIVKIIIFVGPRKFVPEKLQKYIQVVQDNGLTDEEIRDHVTQVCNLIKRPVPPNPVKMFRGLTTWEINQAISRSIIVTRKDPVNPKRVDPVVVAEYKREQLHKTDLLQYVDTSAFTFDDVGGVELFKEWCRKVRAAWTEEGRAFGLRPPRGVLAVGVWGCGKSLSVKAMGHAWGLPVIAMEMGRLRSSGVGESEANVYRATRLIEAVAPCVTGETQVTLSDGSTAAIEDLWQDGPDGLEVRTWNERKLRVETTRVLAITRREAEAFRVSAANGYYLNATANHQHYVMRGGMPKWVRTDALMLGDMFAAPVDEGAHCEWVKVIDVTSIGEHPVYDLACEGADTHSFFANGLITHNCIVWVDEAEKSLSGNASSGASDAGTTSRTIGILSTWLQETKAPVCIAMTANSIKTMPVEFVNRMDERFFFDLPSEDERIEILKIHLRKVGQDPEDFDLADLADRSKNMVGREIEQAIASAMIESFDAGKSRLDSEILGTVLSSKPRILRTMVDELREILDWVGYDPDVGEGIRARFASKTRSETFRKLDTA